MIRKNIYLGIQQIGRLKKLSKVIGLSYSELVRRAIDEYLDKYEQVGNAEVI